MNTKKNTGPVKVTDHHGNTANNYRTVQGIAGIIALGLLIALLWLTSGDWPVFALSVALYAVDKIQLGASQLRCQFEELERLVILKQSQQATKEAQS